MPTAQASPARPSSTSPATRASRRGRHRDGDDGTFTLDLATNAAVTAFGAYRAFGTDVTVLQINSNGLVGLGNEATLPGNYYGSTLITGLSTIQVSAMDLSVGTATTDYDTADPAQYPVGVYYGLSDTNGDGVQELVITWYHAYDFGSPNYTAATPSTARVLHHPARPLPGTAWRTRRTMPRCGTSTATTRRARRTAATRPRRRPRRRWRTTSSRPSPRRTALESALYRFRSGTAGAAANVVSAGPSTGRPTSASASRPRPSRSRWGRPAGA